MHAGPQLYKTVEAAVYTTLVYANDTNSVPLGNVYAHCRRVPLFCEVCMLGLDADMTFNCYGCNCR